MLSETEQSIDYLKENIMVLEDMSSEGFTPTVCRICLSTLKWTC